MASFTFVPLIYNFSLLFSLVFIVDVWMAHRRMGRAWHDQVVIGLVAGTIGAWLVSVPWLVGDGFVLEMRSVVLATAGLLWGVVPTVVAMGVMAAVSLGEGGAITAPGIAVMAVAGTMGIVWRQVRAKKVTTLGGLELYGFGLAVQGVVWALMWALPGVVVGADLRRIALPTLLFYPAATWWLGRLIMWRLRHQEQRRALEVAEERYRSIFESSLDGIMVTRTSGEILAANPAACEMLGRCEAEIIAAGREGLVDGTDPRLAEALDERERTGKVRSQFRMVRGDGTKFPVEVSSAAVTGPDGGVWTALVMHDMSTHEATVEALRRSEAALKQAQRVAKIGSWAWHIRENRLEWSDEMYRIFDIDAEEFTGDLGDVVNQAIHPADRAAVEQANVAVAKHGKPVPLTYRIVRRDGSQRVVWAEAGEMVRDAAGEPAILTGIVQDITARKATEDALRRSEARYRQLFDLAPVCVVVHADGVVLYVNQAAVKLLAPGGPDVLPGCAIGALFPPAATVAGGMRLAHLVGGDGVEYPVVESFRRRDGKLLTVSLVESRLADEGVNAVQSILVDLTDQRETQARLHLLATAVEAAAYAVVITDAEGIVEYVNPAFCTLTGYSVVESVGHSPRELVRSGKHDRAFYQDLWQTILGRDVWQGQVVNRRKDGSLYPEEMTITPVLDEGGEIAHFVAIKRDITVRRQQERHLTAVSTLSFALRRTTTRAAVAQVVADQLALLFEECGVLVATEADEELGLYAEAAAGGWAGLAGTSVRRRALYGDVEPTADLGETFEVGAGEAVQTATDLPAYDVVTVVPLLGRREVAGHLAVGSAGAPAAADVKLLVSLGEIVANALFREQLHEQVLTQAQQMQKIMDTVPHGLVLGTAAGDVLHLNARAEKKLSMLAPAWPGEALHELGGVALGTLLTRPASGLRHELRAGDAIFEVVAESVAGDDTHQQWVMLIDDVTEARQAQARIQQQERLATVGQLAAGIAHDFNNIMAVIVLYAEVVGRAKGLSERDQTRLRTVQEQGRHAADLIRQILDFSRQAELERIRLDLLPLLKEQVKLLERTLPESIVIRLRYGDERLVIEADPTRVQQVVMNLAINARDAMPAGGTLTVGVGRVSVGPGAAAPLAEMEAGEWIRVAVSDTGSGIEADVLPRIFDPFFTTKPVGKGTGLGLAQVHGIVMQHGGHIDVESAPGRGTTVTIYWPAAGDEGVTALETAGGVVVAGRGERVLVVEDSGTLRCAIREMLESAGYGVLDAPDGVAALEIVEAAQEPIELVLTDRVMPRMGGGALCAALRRGGYGMPVILMSGHSPEEDSEPVDRADVAAELSKPFEGASLARLVGHVLREARQAGDGEVGD